MRLVLLGEADDARGFRLAGVEATVCRTRADVDRAVELFEDGDQQTSVVLVSAPVYQLAPSAIDALQDRPHWPIVVVLPEHGNAGRHETNAAGVDRGGRDGRAGGREGRNREG